MNLGLSIDKFESDSNVEAIGIKGAGNGIINMNFVFTGMDQDDSGKIYQLVSAEGNWPIDTLRNSVEATSGRKILDVLKEQAAEEGENTIDQLELKVVEAMYARTRTGEPKRLLNAYAMYNGLGADGQPYLPLKADARGSWDKDWVKIGELADTKKNPNNTFWADFYKEGYIDGGEHMYRYNYKVSLVAKLGEGVE